MSKKSTQVKLAPTEQTKPPRKLSDIQQEYHGLCMRAGHTQYQIATLQKDLDLVNDALRSLNREAEASKKLEDEEKAKAEASKKPEEKKEEAPSV